MTTHLKEAAEPGALDKLKEYLSSDSLKELQPALLGGAAGLGIGALATGPRAGENPRQRAMRTVRNALLAGVVGGAGAQAVSGAADAFSAVTEPGTPKPPGFHRSLAGRAMYPAVLATGLNPLLYFARKGHQLDSVRSMFRGEMKLPVSPPLLAPSAAAIRFDPPDNTDAKGVREHYRSVLNTLKSHYEDPNSRNSLLRGLARNSALPPGDVRSWAAANLDDSIKAKAKRLINPFGVAQPTLAGRTRAGRIGAGFAAGSYILGPHAVEGLAGMFSEGTGDVLKDTITGGIVEEPPAPQVTNPFAAVRHPLTGF